MADRDLDRDIEDILREEVRKRLLHADKKGKDGSTFSRKEVMDAVRRRVRWKGTSDSEKLVTMHRKGQMSRRKFLHMLGLGLGGATVASSGIGYFMGTKVFDNGEHTGLLTGMATGNDPYPDAPGDTVQRFGPGSLSDAIDAFNDGGIKVILEPGEYDYDGFGKLDPGNSSIIGDGEVTFNVTGTNDGGFDAQGDILLKNIVISGQSEGGKSGVDTNPGEDVTITVENVHMPDGGTGDEDRAWYIHRDHIHPSGTVTWRNCYCANFPGDTWYTDKSPTLFQGCMAENNGVSNIRVGKNGTVIDNCVIVISETDLAKPRGLFVRQPTDNCILQNCDLTHEDGPPIELDDEVDTGGTIRNIRIHTNSSYNAINEAPTAERWDVQNVCITGDGNTDHPFDSGVTTGNCDREPRTEPPWCYSDQPSTQQTGQSSTGN